ncbi:MAG: glycosyltransferase [Lentisphaeria bacterium]|nr:glycosyltransferase [Lentisphaeria bacterium]
MNTKPSILFVGNLVDVKAPERAIAAFAVFAEWYPQAVLDIVGDGPLRNQLAHQTERLGLTNRITFHGRQAPERVADMMRRAACLLLTSRSEGMPNVVIECLACGTPVVANAVGEAPFLIKSGINGYSIAVGKQIPADEAVLVESLADGLKKVVAQSWDAVNIAKTVNNFTWAEAARIVAETILM